MVWRRMNCEINETTSRGMVVAKSQELGYEKIFEAATNTGPYLEKLVVSGAGFTSMA